MKRIKAIDYLKTIAIIGVLLFHVGAIQNGYLGVEVFFVCAGFLMIKGINNDEFKPIQYIIKRIAAFWPLVAIVGVISIGIGYFTMLPDDYENLAESVIASNVFCNNILLAITTKDYWNISNVYKPLMHMWYIGVLIQSIVFLSIFLWIASKISKKKGIKYSLILISVFSFVVWCMPCFSTEAKFFYFPFRLFEITIGCLISYLPDIKINTKVVKLFGDIGIGLLFFILFSGWNISNNAGIIIVVFLTAITIWSRSNVEEDIIDEKIYKLITVPGRYSYDVYVWHQAIIAFLYYSVFQSFNSMLVCLTIVLTIVLSAVSVILRKEIKFMNSIWKRIIFAIVFVTIGFSLSGYIYIHAGVTRNVPELGIDQKDIHRNMHSEYVDRPYFWDKDFNDDAKIHVLVLGDSYGRDFANILKESKYSNDLEISYIYGSDFSQATDRISQADFVFYGAYGWKTIPEGLKNIPKEKLYVIGNKSFGNSNGIIYANRTKDNYFEQRVELPNDMILNNNAFKGIYGDNYIDMITPLIDENNKIRIFTDDNYYISQDCKHLTKQGAQYYSRILNLSFLTAGDR